MLSTSLGNTPGSKTLWVWAQPEEVRGGKEEGRNCLFLFSPPQTPPPRAHRPSSQHPPSLLQHFHFPNSWQLFYINSIFSLRSVRQVPTTLREWGEGLCVSSRRKELGRRAGMGPSGAGQRAVLVSPAGHLRSSRAARLTPLPSEPSHQTDTDSTARCSCGMSNDTLLKHLWACRALSPDHCKP